MYTRKILPLVTSIFVIACIMVFCMGAVTVVKAQCYDVEFTSDFPLETCKFKPTGENPYFILKEGYQLYLEGEEDGEAIAALITVLPDKETINLPGMKPIKTRVVEEREWADGELVEVSRNFFAICKNTGDVYYFGEDVDDYEDGEIVGHEGAWRAGVDGAMPGIIMPGSFLLGARYYQEMAPGVAEDLGMNEEMGLDVSTDAGDFEDCVLVLESSGLDCEDESEKIYAPGVGLVVDDELELVDYGHKIMDRE